MINHSSVCNWSNIRKGKRASGLHGYWDETFMFINVISIMSNMICIISEAGIEKTLFKILLAGVLSN